MIINRNILAILRTLNPNLNSLNLQKKLKHYTNWTSKAATTEFVCKITNRKKISNEHFNLCVTKISLDEIIKSTNSETNNKAPGNDGVTVEFYTFFK